MINNQWSILAGLMVMVSAGISLAQNNAASNNTTSARPAIAFPPTPTPAPKAEPLTVEKLDELLIPSQFLARTSEVLAIAYGGFRRSQVDPCGCVTHQLGGLDKEARLIKRIDELKIPAIQLDAGGFIRDMPDQKTVEQSKILLKGLGKIGYDVVNVGFTDLTITPAELKKTAEEAGVKLVSSNIADSTGTLVFEPYVVSEVTMTNGQSIRVGVLGITRPRVELSGAPAGQASSIASGSANSSDTLSISDPIAAVNKYLPELKQKSDFVVVLNYDRRGNVEKLIAGVEDKSLVDVIILGENSQIQGSVQALNGIQVVSGGYEGRQLGTLYMELKDNNVVSTWNKHIEVLQTIPPVDEITKLIEEAHTETVVGNPGAVSPAPASPTKLDLTTP